LDDATRRPTRARRPAAAGRGIGADAGDPDPGGRRGAGRDHDRPRRDHRQRRPSHARPRVRDLDRDHPMGYDGVLGRVRERHPADRLGKSAPRREGVVAAVARPLRGCRAPAGRSSTPPGRSRSFPPTLAGGATARGADRAGGGGSSAARLVSARGWPAARRRQRRERGRTKSEDPLMVELVLSFADTLHLRFAISPVGETVRLARAIANPRVYAKEPHLDWIHQHRSGIEQLLRDHDLQALLVLLSGPRGDRPSFLTPTPATPVGEIEAELEQIRRTPSTQVESELARWLEGASLDPASERLLRGGGAARTIVDELEAVWEALVAPSWPRLRDLLERDVLHRSRLLAKGGLAMLFAEFEPQVRLHDRRLGVKIGAGPGGQPSWRGT